MNTDQNNNQTQSGLSNRPEHLSTDTNQEKEPKKAYEPFGPVIYAYTRAQALADGVQVDVSETAREAGIRFPVFLARTVFDSYITVPEGVEGQDEAGRLTDVISMLGHAIRKRINKGLTRISFGVMVRMKPKGWRDCVQFVAEHGPRDINDPSPVITVMLPDEA